LLKQIDSSLKWISKLAHGCLTFVACVISTILVDDHFAEAARFIV
jgi:hypothetical protein